MDVLSRERARALRRTQTDAEQCLWSALRAHCFRGLKFKRQKPLGPYIVDFICMELRLIIELDGGQHAEQLEYDQRRDRWLEGQGFTVLRFWNHEVLQQTDALLEQVWLWVEQQRPSPPAPLQIGRAHV